MDIREKNERRVNNAVVNSADFIELLKAVKALTKIVQKVENRIYNLEGRVQDLEEQEYNESPY